MSEPSPPDMSAANGGVEPIGVAEYNAFISGLQLVHIRLASAEIDAPNPPERRPVAPVLNVDDATYRNGDDHFVVRQTLVFTGTYEAENEPALRLRASFEIRYTAAERMTEALFAEFRSRNVLVNSWPYFREYVQSTLARVGWPVMTLPAFKTAPVSGGPHTDDED